MTFVCKKLSGSVTTCWRKALSGEVFTTENQEEIGYLKTSQDFEEVKACTRTYKKSGSNSKA
ncbi:MAG: hypothetical protein KA140_03205 [Caldisericia bacterium]|nr:hypothetical protein [Caldisericia bacterium]